MAVAAMVGYEAGEVNADNIAMSGTASYSTSTVRTGARSVRCNPASAASGYTSGAGGLGWTHFAVNVASMPSVQRTIYGTGGTTVNVRLESTGALSYYETNTLIGTSSTTLTTGAWYWIGIRISTGTTVVCLQIDGADEVTGTLTSGAANDFLGFSGTEASAVDAYFDDAIRDDAGFLAPSKVDIALPISDNTRTAVTGGAGGTTNLWDAVNNTPPAGVASASETDLTNIEYPASLTESYIANLETYTTLGIGASDTVLAVRGQIRHGEDIATGTKNGTYVGITNPTQTDNTAFTFGNDGGAHGAEPAATLWKNTFGTVVTSPSVTLGTSPTIQVDRVSQARVGCIDFMCMLVAWTPAAPVARVPRLTTMPQLLAH